MLALIYAPVDQPAALSAAEPFARRIENSYPPSTSAHEPGPTSAVIAGRPCYIYFLVHLLPFLADDLELVKQGYFASTDHTTDAPPMLFITGPRHGCRSSWNQDSPAL
jgi:hypothetical protein